MIWQAFSLSLAGFPIGKWQRRKKFVWRQFLAAQNERKKLWRRMFIHEGWRMNKHIADSHSQSSIFHSEFITALPRKFCCEPAIMLRRLFIMFQVINAAKIWRELMDCENLCAPQLPMSHLFYDSCLICDNALMCRGHKAEITLHKSRRLRHYRWSTKFIVLAFCRGRLRRCSKCVIERNKH